MDYHRLYLIFFISITFQPFHSCNRHQMQLTEEIGALLHRFYMFKNDRLEFSFWPIRFFVNDLCMRPVYSLYRWLAFSYFYIQRPLFLSYICSHIQKAVLICKSSCQLCSVLLVLSLLKLLQIFLRKIVSTFQSFENFFHFCGFRCFLRLKISELLNL